MLILLPHLIWLIDNNYTTIVYGLQRTGGIGSFFDHLIYPIIFLFKQIGVLFPFFIISLFLIKKVKFKTNLKDEKLIFLIFTAILPIILIFFTSMILGALGMWMTLLFFGVFLAYIFKDIIKKV